MRYLEVNKNKGFHFRVPEIQSAAHSDYQKIKRVRDELADIETDYHVRADVPFHQMGRPDWKHSRQKIWNLAVREGNKESIYDVICISKLYLLGTIKK